ncbi:MAG: HAMP domain-containing sensor histidine kinase, partial [Ignavibacteria bacterium]|nr:HAMP domain-containing sensor histidine kinase [Ignavibacteria bacterium]
IAANTNANTFLKCDLEHIDGLILDQLNSTSKFNQLPVNEFLKSVFSEFEVKKLNHYSKEVICSHRDGKAIDTNLSVSVFEKDGKNFIVKISDISIQKAAEREFKEAKKRAEENDRQKTAFLANMSHEIRTPLNSIMGFSNLLIEDDPDIAERQEFLHLINTAGKSLLQLIDDIIDISKIEAGQIKISQSDIEVNQVLDQLLLSFNNEKVKRGKHEITLRINKDSGNKPLIIYNDPLRFRQIMSNMLVNALKFIDHGFIEFGYTEMEPDFIQFYVKDTGIGISREKAHMVFQRFGQLDNSYKRNREGTGLGLAITKQLVELMGGKIWFDSEYGKGTTFYFTLPNSKNNDSTNMPYGTVSNLSFNWSEYV